MFINRFFGGCVKYAQILFYYKFPNQDEGKIRNEICKGARIIETCIITEGTIMLLKM